MGRPKGVIRQIADEAGLDPATVRRSLESAGLTEAQAAADPAKAVETVKTLADNDRAIGHAVNGRGEGGANREYAAAKAEAERHRAEKLRLDNERKRGKLIDRADATETITRILGDLRATLLAMGGTLAPVLAGQTDVRAIAKLIDNEVRDKLSQFADVSKLAEALDKETLS